MNRLEFLNKLEEVIRTQPLIESQYTDYVNGQKCHCILGHAYKIVGKEDVLSDMSNEYNIKHYDALSFRHDKYSLEETGLSSDELVNLQQINDGFGIEAKEQLLNFITRLKAEQRLG